MKYVSTRLAGAHLIELEPLVDERGFFARTWCAREFESHGLNPKVSQTSISLTLRKGTLRGMHYQAEPYSEAKLVRCCAGSVYDVIVDLRADSPTYCEWLGIELTAQNRLMLYVPEGFAHGFQTLMDNTEMSYQISESYRSEYVRGVRWDDPLFGIRWPIPDPIISARDSGFADFIP